MEIFTKNKTESRSENTPEVRFGVISTKEESQILDYFLSDGYWEKTFYKVYPELEEIVKKYPDREERIKKYKDFLDNVHSTNTQIMESSSEKFEEEWRKIEKQFLEELSKQLETDWLPDENIKGQISVLPVYPRDLKNKAFLLGYKDIQEMIEISAHEIVHFIWFKKWKEVFPEMSEEEYERPHLAWRLSEIIDPIILQCNPTIKELIKPKLWGYSSFKKVQIEGISMVDYFKKIYEECVLQGDSFEVTIKKLWEEAKKHQKEIEKF